MPTAYDDSNIFARILRGEIPNRTVAETEHALAFEDIHPAAPHHVLVIPKGRYVNFAHFAAEASAAEIADFHRCVAQVIAARGLAPDAEGAGGFRAITNAGEDGGQDVPHFHLHILGGRRVGPMLSRRNKD